MFSEFLSEVVIDTDSPVIARDVNDGFPEVKVINRPSHLTDGDTPMNDVLLHDVDLVQADYYFQTHSTNPLLKTDTIDKSIKKFMDQYPRYDSLFGVTLIQNRLWDGLARPINHNPDILLRTQDLPPTYMENSCIYIFSGQTLRLRHNRIGERPLMFEINPLEAQDIDVETDFQIAEMIYQQEWARN